MPDQIPGAEAFVPDTRSLPALRRAAQVCRGCPLWKCGTQTVFGAGARRPVLMIVGEQPGDQEDLAGHPFVGPSGKLLDRALEEAGIDRGDTYVTNAVKHFKWTRTPGGKRRIHKKPSAREVRACRPWLEAEIAALEPPAILALGATAAQSLFGASTKVTVQRGKVIKTPLADAGFVTVHPSAVLRAPGPERAIAERAFMADLRKVSRYLAR